MAKLSPDNHLSGSVLPAYLGLSPYQTAYDVLASARSGEREELDSLPIDCGNALEPVILDRGLRLLGIDPASISTWLENGVLAAKKHPEMELYYSDDGLLTVENFVIEADEVNDIHVVNESGRVVLNGPVVLEAKFTTVPRRNDDPPLYRGPVQLQAGMMCHGASHGILITCYGGRDLVVHVFEAHPATQQLITDGVESFEQHMRDDTLPDPSSIPELVQYYDDPSEEPINLATELLEAVESYQDAKAAIKEAEAVRQEQAAILMSALGNSTVGVVDEVYKVSWPVRRFKAKAAKYCPACEHELEPAKAAAEVRQKTINIKELEG